MALAPRGALVSMKIELRGDFEAPKVQNVVFILMKLHHLLCYIPSNVVSLLMAFKGHFPRSVGAADLPCHIGSRCPGGSRASDPCELLTPLLVWQSRWPPSLLLGL